MRTRLAGKYTYALEHVQTARLSLILAAFRAFFFDVNNQVVLCRINREYSSCILFSTSCFQLGVSLPVTVFQNGVQDGGFSEFGVFGMSDEFFKRL